jgi:hypothetical protein
MNYYKFFEFLEQKENRQIPVKAKLLKDPNYQITQDDANGNLDLFNTKIKSLPLGLIIKGNLNLGFTPITSLPLGLIVKGNFFLSNTKIKFLPSDLSVEGYFSLVNTKITSLPPDLKVGGNLYLGGTPLSKSHTEQEIRQMAPGIKGDIR